MSSILPALPGMPRVAGSQTPQLPALQRGASNDNVLYLKDLLAEHGFELESSSVFDAQTEAAVREFQTEMGLVRPNGRVDARTWWLLAQLDNAEDLPLLKEGSQHAAVARVQYHLKQHGLDVAVDGRFGPGTKTAIEAFQEQRGLAKDGQVGLQTWLALLEVTAPPVEDTVDAAPTSTAPTAPPTPWAPAPPPPTATTTPPVTTANLPTLRRGASGPEVESLQQRLVALGIDCPVNGSFDDATRNAVRAFQRRAGRVDDAIVGANTWTALALAERGGLIQWQPNPRALAAARTSDAAAELRARTAEHASIYRRAAELTGVPAAIIAAIHFNESSQGAYNASVRGPESGFGLDDRSVTTAWGNEVLARHRLGTWQRGVDNEAACLQAAVIAAEHLKRMAGYCGITIDANMTPAEVAGLTTAYMAGQGAGRLALRRGHSWAFDLRDNNPHPLHPGGTSRTAGGRTVRVGGGRKPGLLRWDTLLPLLQEQLGNR